MDSAKGVFPDTNTLFKSKSPVTDRWTSGFFSTSRVPGVSAAVPEPHDLEHGIPQEQKKLFPDRHGGLHILDKRPEIRPFRCTHWLPRLYDISCDMSRVHSKTEVIMRTS